MSLEMEGEWVDEKAKRERRLGEREPELNDWRKGKEEPQTEIMTENPMWAMIALR